MIARRLLAISLLTLAFFAMPVGAETYKGIGYGYNLNDVAAIFPNADFESSKPGWAKPHEALVTISGMGISGRVVIKVDNAREFWRQAYYETTDPLVERFAWQACNYYDSLPDKFRWEVQWVRWIPTVPVPLENVIRQYGKFDKRGVDQDDFDPYVEWTKRGITAYTIENEKKVAMIDFAFDKKESQAGWGRITQRVEDFIKANPHLAAPPNQESAPPDPDSGKGLGL